MTIPKEIVDKMEQVNSLIAEISEWMYENIETDGSKHSTTDWHGDYKCETYYEFVDAPHGEEQNDGEYCDQHQGYIEDMFWGNYYYPTEKGNYFTFSYEV